MKTFKEILDETQRLFPRMTATLRSEKNKKEAIRAYKLGDRKAVNRHVDAADRYERISKGKPAFAKEEVQE